MNCEICYYPSQKLYEFVFWTSPTPHTCKVEKRVQLDEIALGGLSAKEYLSKNEAHLLSLPSVK